MHKKQEIIIRNYRNGESVSRIAREVAVCRKTARKYIRAYSEEKKKFRYVNYHTLLCFFRRKTILIPAEEYYESERTNHRIHKNDKAS